MSTTDILTLQELGIKLGKFAKALFKGNWITKLAALVTLGWTIYTDRTGLKKSLNDGLDADEQKYLFAGFEEGFGDDVENQLIVKDAFQKVIGIVGYAMDLVLLFKKKK